MENYKSFSIKLRFSGKSVDQYGLDLYDGSTSFNGFAQAIQIIVHAYMTHEVVSRATALKGAKIYFGAPRRGSVLFDIVTMIEQYPITATLSAAVFYDFVKISLSKASGYFETKPETKAIEKLNQDEIFFDRLAETLEGSLQRAHRAIDHGVKSVTIERPRSQLVLFDQETSKWVHTRDENPAVEKLKGNVTRYNSKTGNGRAYVKSLKKIVPFRLNSKFPETKKGLLSWSLHGDTVSGEKNLNFRASKIESATGDTKRLILVDCEIRKNP